MSGEPKLYRIDPETKESAALQEVKFADLGLKERSHIQEWVASNSGILDDNLLIVAKEYSGFDRTNERLDLLGVDTDGILVVIELKRDDSGSDAYWQAIRYASYIRDASPDHIVEMLAEYANISDVEAHEKLRRHLDNISNLNYDQRIILASHRFAPEVTSAALWLNERAPGTITCVQLKPYRDAKDSSLYLQANTIIPVPVEEDYKIRVGNGQLEERPSGRAQNTQRTQQRNQRDEINRCLRKAADIALNSITGVERPDQTSKWAGGWGGAAYNYRFYRVWYSHEPWSNGGLSYRMNLMNSPRRKDESEPWKVNVEFGDFSKELGERLQGLEIHKDQKIESNRIFVPHTSRVLNDEFSKELSETLKGFIEQVTGPVEEWWSNHKQQPSDAQ